jgi:hypothetical protein
MAGLSLVGYSIYNGLAPLTKLGADGAPIQGPRVICVPLQFTSILNSITVEFFKEGTEKQLDFIQTIAMNNSSGTTALTVSADVTQHSVTIAAGKQIICPLFCIETPRLTFTKPAVGNENVLVWVTNIYHPTAVW